MAAVDGLVSGMDTATVIKQLLDLERIPQQRLVQKQQDQQARIAAFQSINAKVLSLQTAADALTKADTWKAFKVTSSSSSVSATASTSALTGSYTFEVVATAKAHSEISTHVFTSTAEQAAAPASTITITKADGSPDMVVDAGDGSLATVAANINAAGGGVKAAVVQVAAGQYRLSLTSTTSGDASSFNVTGLTYANQDLVVGADAVIGMGTPTSAGPPPVYDITIRSSSNTFTDVLPGVTFTVSKLETVTLDVASDAAGISGKVQGMISAANAVLDEIAKQTAFDSTTNKKSPLTGDSTVRSLQQRILEMGSGYGNVTLAGAGVQLTKDGHFSFDSAKFQTAYQADPTGTTALFRPGGAMAPTDPAGVSFYAADDQTVPGTYAVAITRAAEQAEVRVAGTFTDGDTVTIRVPGHDPVTVTAAGDTPATMVDKVNAAISGKGLGVIATLDGADLLVRSDGYGSQISFSVDVTSATAATSSSVARLAGTIAGTETFTIAVPSQPDLVVSAQVGDTMDTLAARLNTQMSGAGLGLNATVRYGAIVIEPTGASPASFAVTVAGGTMTSDVAGVDAEGTINGVVASGTGQLLTSPVTDTTLHGLSLLVSATGPMSGQFTYQRGLAQRLDSLAGDAIRSDTGQLTTAIDGGERMVDSLKDQIAAWDERLSIRETMLRRQFSTLETQLGTLRNQSTWLSGQLAGLAANNG